MCKPKFQKLSTSMMSTNNLKNHVASAHPYYAQKFQECIDSAKPGKNFSVLMWKQLTLGLVIVLIRPGTEYYYRRYFFGKVFVPLSSVL